MCERWHYATQAYQTVTHGDAGSGAPAEMVQATSGWATGGTEPDRAVLLDMSADRMGERLARPLDRIEARMMIGGVEGENLRLHFDTARVRIVPDGEGEPGLTPHTMRVGPAP